MRMLLLAFALLCAPLAHAQVNSPAIDARFGHWYTATAQATPVVAEASDFTAVADIAGSLAGTYFTAHAALDAYCVAVWYKVSGTGTAPTVSGCTNVEVDISTGDAAATVASSSRTALNTAPYTTYFTITGATTHIILTNVANGAATDGSVGTSGFSVSKTQGVSGALAISSPHSGDQGWKICNAGVNTSTWLAVSQTAGDPTSTGIRLGKGQCYQCMSCSTGLLTKMYVSAQAASNDYSVVEFKQ